MADGLPVERLGSLEEWLSAGGKGFTAAISATEIVRGAVSTALAKDVNKREIQRE